MSRELQIKWQRADLAKPQRSMLYLDHCWQPKTRTWMTGISVSILRKIYRYLVNGRRKGPIQLSFLTNDNVKSLFRIAYRDRKLTTQTLEFSWSKSFCEF